jgi:hypothetical protein
VAFNVPVTLVERDFPTNMIVLKGQDIDVILGMNWLAQHKAILNTDLRTIRLSYGQEEVLLSIPVAIPAKPFGRVYEAIIPEIQDILVVCEFPDVFSEDLPGLPPVGVSDPGGPSTRPTSEFVTVCPCPDGLAQDGTQEGNAARVISYQGVLVVGVTSVRERERVSLFVCSSLRAPPQEGPVPPFYRCKERVQVYNGGVAMR